MDPYMKVKPPTTAMADIEEMILKARKLCKEKKTTLEEMLNKV